MNQILDYNPRRNGGGSNNKSLFKIFAVMILIFAIVLIGSGIYSIYKENEHKIPTKTGEEDKTKAMVNVEVEESTAIIKVKHDKGIEKVTYQWNDGSEKTTSGNKENNFEKKIDIPTGDNTLYITVIDVEKVETTFEKQISVEHGVDIQNPKIEVKVTEDKKLKITATDDTALDFITYRWNDEEEKIVKADESNPTKIEVIINIPKDTNEIVIVAVDTSNNTTTNAPLKFTGLIKPTIDVKITEDGKNLVIVAEHEKGIEKIQYTMYNGDPNDPTVESKDYSMTDLNDKRIQFEQPLYVGYNRIILQVVSSENTVEEFNGECSYTPTTPTNNPTSTNTTSNPSTTNTTNQ